MDDQQIREIAEAAFKAHFGHIGILSINVEPGIDFGDDFPVVEVRIIYDAKMEEVLNGDTMAVFPSSRQKLSMISRRTAMVSPLSTSSILAS